LPLWQDRWCAAVLAGARFLLGQEAAILEVSEANQDVTRSTGSGNGPRRREDAAASEERQPTKLALAVPTDWRADG
jgi:hypothetical protein